MDVEKEQHIIAELSANDRVLGAAVKKLVWTLDSVIQERGRRKTDGKLCDVAELLLGRVREMEDAIYRFHVANGDRWEEYMVLKGFDESLTAL